MNLLNVGIRNSKSQFNNLNEFSFIDGSIYYTQPDNSEDIDFGIIASDTTTLLVH